jgi:tetratricopeptide (TPR) repeat protein
MSKGKRQTKDINDRREEALRPNPYLGYDRDRLGFHLMSRGAYKIAETQFRRAAWLNPYEPAFKEHLALCLYTLGRYLEAYNFLKEVPENPENRNLMEQIKKFIETNSG